MRILLTALNASYVHTNLAVRCIAHTLSAAGHAVQIREYTLKDRTRRILSDLYESDAEVYGFSVYIWNREAVLQLAAQLKLLRPEIPIVLGGPEISYEDASFFRNHPYIDNILSGEGESVFPAYLAAPPPRHTVVCGEPYTDFAQAGILYDEYPPARQNGGIVYYESSRGCPYRCSYCLSSATGAVRAKSAERVICQLRELDKLPGVRVIKLVDRTFNFDRRRADQIWRALAGAEFTKTYHFEICADLLDGENFATLASLPPGRIQLECGVQSTHPPTLRAIGRTSDPDKILAALRRIREMGNIHLHADLIAGLPGEDFERFGQSFDACYPVCEQLQLGFLKLLPGTKLREESEGRGFRYSPHPPYEILQSDALSFSELCRLHNISDAMERFSSENFGATLAYLLSTEPSPFAFFDALATALPRLREMSQREAVLALREFALERGADPAMLEMRLITDWLLHESGSPPYPLKIPHAPEEAELRRIYCRTHPGTSPSAICIIDQGTEGMLLIHREKHTAETLCESLLLNISQKKENTL